MSGGDFFDSNIFVYLFDEVDSRKHQIALALVQNAITNASAVISYQVVQETLNVVTKKLKPPVAHDVALRFMETTLQPMWKVMPSPDLFKRALRNKAQYALSFYDSLIVAAAQEADCKRLYSEDMQHGQLIGKLRIVNPFVVG